MKKILLALLFLWALSQGLLAQSISNYSFAASSGTFTDLVSPTNISTSGGNVDDGYSNNIPIGFDFWYMGTRYTSISASTNGWFTLGSNITNAVFVNNLANGAALRPVIAPLWDDLDIQSASNVTYKITGSAPNRVFTLQSLNLQWQYNATGNTISFQANLYENTGKVEFIYRPEAGTLSSPTASIGITASATGSGNYLSLNGAGTSPTVSSTTETSNISVKPASGQTYSFTPPVPVAPTSLTFSLVGVTSMNLNWTDNSTNERVFAIYRSTDGVNYTFISQTAAAATSSVQSGLTGSTIYYWKVYAVSEGGLSTSLDGNQTTQCLSAAISQIPSANLIANYRFEGNANDASGNNSGTLQNSPLLVADRFDIANKAFSFNGSSQYVSTANAYVNPSNFSVSIWFKTNTITGGKLIGFGSNQTGLSANYDRHIYMNNAGQIYFGDYPSFVVTVNSPLSYNDNIWHLATATLSSTSGMTLFMDGVQVAATGNATAQNYTGYWRIGFDNNSGWTSQPSSFYFNGILDDALIYSRALNASEVATLFTSPDGAGNSGSACIGSSVSLSATTIVGATYAWTGPNGFTSSVQNPTFTYSAASTGVYTLQVTVSGCTATAYTNVTPSTLNLWTGNISTDWATAGNWCTGFVPTSTTNVTIPASAIRMPSIVSSVSTNNLTINLGATLTTTLAGTLNIAGKLTNNGTVINGGTTNFNGTSGQQTFSGVSSFYNLTLNNSIGLLVPAAITVANNLTISSGTLNVNNFGLTIGGNWINNVSTTAFTAGTATVTFNSAAPQTIGGTFATSFNHLTIANTASTVTLLANTSVSGNLTVSNGTLDLGIYTANRASAGGTLTVSNNATLKIGGTNTFPSNYSGTTLVVASTVEYSGTNQTVASRTYGNLKLTSSSGAAVKTLPVVALTIVGNLISAVGTGTSVSFTATTTVNVNGNVSIGVSTTFNGGNSFHTIGGNWTNDGIYSPGTGTIAFAGPGAQVGGSGTQNFYNLTVSASMVSFSNTNIGVSNNLTTSGSGSFSQASGGTFTMSGSGKVINGSGISLDNLVISGSITGLTSFTIAGNLSVSGSFSGAGTITMSGTSKTISGAGTRNFSVLSVTGTITTATNFSISSALTVSGTLTATAGTCTFSGTSTVDGTANLYNITINGTSLQLSTNSILGIANALTITAGTLNATSTLPNVVNFNGTGAQNINAITYNNLVLSNGNTKTALGNTTITDLTIGSGTTFNPSSYTHSIYGSWINNGTFTASSSTVQFLGLSTAYVRGATIFNILTSNTSASSTELILESNVTAATVNMTSGIIETGSNTLTITNTRTGSGYIYGNIQRTHSFTTGVDYAFEGPYNTISFSAVAAVTSVTVSVTRGPISDFPFGNSIARIYNIVVPSGTYTATLRLHYEDEELNGNIESDMGLWNYDGTQWIPFGKSANNSSNNYVEQNGITSITDRWTISINPSVVLWNGSVSTDWNTAANWTVYVGPASTPPSASDVAVMGGIPAVYQPTISTTVSIKNLVFVAPQAITLSMASGGSLTSGDVIGVWSSNVTHALHADNRPITINGNLVLSDGVNGHAIDLRIGSGSVTVVGSVEQTGGANINFTGIGTLNIHNNFEYSSGVFTAGTGTVVYNGDENQHVAHITYNNLTINKASGIGTIDSVANVTGNLLISAGKLDNLSTTSITGNVTIATGATFENTDLLHVGGNWNNSGNYTGLGTHVKFNGGGTQTISSTIFNNVVIDKPVGSSVILTGNIVINGDLTVTSGTFDIKTFDCNRSTQGGTLTLADSATFIVGANNSPLNFSSGTLANSSTVIADGIGPQFIFGVDFGHLIFRNAGLKTLVAPIIVKGNLTIESGATFDGGSQTLTLNGNWLNSGTFIPSTSTILWSGATKLISGNTTFNKVTVYGSYTILNNVTFNGLLDIDNAASLSGGVSILTTLHGDLINRGVLNTSGTTTFTGTVLQTLSLINATTTFALTVNFNGTVSPVLNSTSAPQFGYLNINNTGGVNPSVGWTIAFPFTVGPGASFNGGASTHTMLGAVTNNGSITSSGTLNFIPASTTTINLGSAFSSTGRTNFGGAGAMTVAGTPVSFGDVVISNSNGAGITPSSVWNLTNNLTINSGSILNTGSYAHVVDSTITINGTLIANSQNLSLGGDWVNNGLFTGPASTVRFMGTSTQNVSGISVTNFNNMIVTNTGANPSVSIESSQNLIGVLTLAGNVVIDTDGSNEVAIFKLISSGDNPTQDASIAVMPAGAQVTGNVTVQRFMTKEGANNTRIYRYISSPVQNSFVSDIQSEIPVTGSFTGTSVCAGCLTNQSMFSYNETAITDINGSGTADFNDGYMDFPDASNTEALTPGKGYAMFVRGNTLSSTLWDVRGFVNVGNVTPVSLPVAFTSSGVTANDGWNLVGNPFPSTIDWDALSGWIKVNLDDPIYIADNGNAVTQFATWNGVAGTNGGSRFIALGQGFWVKANGAGIPSLQTNENSKVAGTQGIFFRESAANDLLRITMIQNAIRDETVIHFREDATPGFDSNADAWKLKNASFNLSSLSSAGDLLAINSWSALLCDTPIKLSIKDAVPGSYILKFTNLDSFVGGSDIALVDQFLNTSVPVAENTEYLFDVTTDANSLGNSRFILQANKEALPITIEKKDELLTVPYTENIQWYFNELPIVGATFPSFKPESSGTYSVIVIFEGCELEGSFDFIITWTEDPLPAGINVFPNPVTNELFITSEENVIESITLMNANGGIIESVYLAGANGKQEVIFNMGNKRTGLYLLKIIVNKKIYIRKILKK